MFNRRGQGTIEYLVIIAIVVVIALVVVGLLLQAMNPAGGVTESTAKNTWRSSTPFAITDWAWPSGTDKNITLVLRNNTYESVNFVSVDMNVNKTATSGFDANGSAVNNVAAGQTFTVTVQTSSTQGVLGACVAGQRFSIPKEQIRIRYSTASISGVTRIQNALADITGTCS